MTQPPDAAGLHFDWPGPLVALIRTAIADVRDIHELSTAIKSALPDDVPDYVKAFVRALDYHPGRPTGTSSAPDDRYGPMFTTTEGHGYPEPLSEVSAETIDAWSDAATLFSTNSVVAARLGDLLWTLRSQPSPHQRARSAQAAFRQQWNEIELASVHRADALIRALEIATELGDAGLVIETAGEIATAVAETLADADWAPGVSLPMLESLCNIPDARQPANLEKLLHEAGERYAADPFTLESVMLLQIQRAGSDQEKRKTLAAQVVAMWRDAAADRGGLVGLSFLERALEFAQNSGLQDAATEIRLLLQQPKTPDELGMQKVSAEVTIPAEVVDKFVDYFAKTQAADVVLAKLAAHCPIKDVETDRMDVRQQMKDFPLVHLFSTIITDDDGTPLLHVVSDEQKFDRALTQHHALAITVWGNMLGRIVKDIEASGHLSPSDFDGHAQGEFIAAEDASAIARGWRLMLAGDHDAALLLLVTRIERVLRNLARTVGLVVFRQPSLDGKSAGSYKGLGDLLRLLEGRVPENERRYFCVLLTERTGLNLRNRAAHGLMSGATLEEAALALHVLLIISSWSTTKPSAAGAEH